MKVQFLAGIAGATLAMTSNAQPVNTILSYQVSRDGVSWTSDVSAAPGERVEVRVTATFVSSPGALSAAGLKLIYFQPVVSNWHADSGDTLLTNSRVGRTGEYFPPDGIGPIGNSRTTPLGSVPHVMPGEYGRISPFGLTNTTTSTYLRGHLGTGTAAGLLRIARADITNWIGEGPTTGASASNNWNGAGGVGCSQIALSQRVSTDPAFNPSTENVVIFAFGFVLGSEADRSMTITTPTEGLGRITAAGSNYGSAFARWFLDNDAIPIELSGGVEVQGATVRVLPSPGTLPLIGLTVLTQRRRRARLPLPAQSANTR